MVVPGIFGTQFRVRPRFAENNRSARWRSLCRQWYQDVDDRSPLGGHDALPCAHRPRSEAAARNFLPAHRHENARSEEHTSELQSLMRISYAVFCLKKKKNTYHKHTHE